MVQETNKVATPDKASPTGGGGSSTIGAGDGSTDEKRKKVGNYVILKTIGEGSFAKVRLGIHLITDMKVAVKVINKREVFKRNYLRANLRREASMMQRMSHTNIVQLHEVMETENSYYIVMDLVQGNEFVKYLTKKRQLDENETRKYIRQIVSAVDHMHRANVIHRDIKLQNFMLDQNNDIVIIDFGLSNTLEEKGFLTTQCGSPAYAAPEIFAHQEYGPAVDVWSIGVNMYAMLLGKLPFKVEHRSRNLAKLHACILKGCEIPNTLSRDCQDLLSRLLEPSPTKRISMQEILRHPFLTYQYGPIELTPYKPHADIRDINRNIIRYLVFKHDYTEREIEEAVLHRKPIAARALYTLIERRLKEGLGWPDRTYNNSVTAASSVTGGTVNDGSSDILILDKLNRREPLLPGRRIPPQLLPHQTSPPPVTSGKLSREKSNYALDEQLLMRANTGGSSIIGGMTHEALSELVPASKLASRKLFHDIVLRKSSAVGVSNGDPTDEHGGTRRMSNSNSLAPIRPVYTPHRVGDPRGNVLIAQQQQRNKPRSLPSSTLDHANQNGFHLPNDTLAGSTTGGSRTPKTLNRTPHIEHVKKSQQQHSPVRYNPAQSLTVKHIGLFLKNSALHSRVSSCSSKSSKSTGGVSLADPLNQPSPPLRIFPPTTTSNASPPLKHPAQTLINYHSHGNLSSATTATRQAIVRTTASPHHHHHLPTSKAPHAQATAATTGQKLMPT